MLQFPLQASKLVDPKQTVSTYQIEEIQYELGTTNKVKSWESQNQKNKDKVQKLEVENKSKKVPKLELENKGKKVQKLDLDKKA